MVRWHRGDGIRLVLWVMAPGDRTEGLEAYMVGLQVLVVLAPRRDFPQATLDLVRLDQEPLTPSF